VLPSPLSRALVFSPTCSHVRNAKFSHILGQYAALSMASLTKNYQSWVTFLSQMSLEENVRWRGDWAPMIYVVALTPSRPPGAVAAPSACLFPAPCAPLAAGWPPTPPTCGVRCSVLVFLRATGHG
jgi:hypothetical protein